MMATAPGAVCLLLAILCFVGVSGAHAQTATLRMVLPVSLDSPTGQNMREFARQVQARTSGALRIELQRYEEREILAAVASGSIEIAAAPLAQVARDVPVGAAFLQPFLFNFDALTEAATRPESEIRILLDSEILRRTGSRVLWWEPYGSRIIVSKVVAANDPVAVVVRPVGAADDQARELISMCGGLPRLLSTSDARTALERGTIAAYATDIMSVRERELWRVADTITNLRYAPSLFVVVINEQAWQKLTAEQQVILAELGQDAQSYMWARFVTVRAEAYALAVENGMRIVHLSARDIAAWRACSASLIETHMARAGPAGRKLFAAYGRLRTSPCCRDASGDAPFAAR